MKAGRVRIGCLFLCALSIFLVVSPLHAEVTFSSREVEVPASCQAYTCDNNADACKACHLIVEPPPDGGTASPQTFMGLSIFMAASSSPTTTVTSPDGKFTVTYPPTVAVGESFTNSVTVWGYALTYYYYLDNVYFWGDWPWFDLDRTYTHDHTFNEPGTHSFKVKSYYCSGGYAICGMGWILTEIGWDVAVGGPVCDTSVTDFHIGGGSDNVLNTGAGDNVTFVGSISSSQSVTWTIAIESPFLPAGDNVVRRFQGIDTGLDNVVWDGWGTVNDTDGPVQSGVYRAILTAEASGCADSRSLLIEVYTAQTCSIYANNFGSSANVASGNLTDSQDLFLFRGGAFPAGLALTYNSLSGYSGSLGRGWTHSSDIFLQPSGGDTYVLRDGDGRETLLIRNGDLYTPRHASYPILQRNPDGTSALSRKDGVVYLFDASGKIAQILDRNGNATTFSYDGTGNLAQVSDPAGRSSFFEYDLLGYLSAVTAPDGRRFAFEYEGGRLARVSYPDGAFWSYAYDAFGRMASKTDPMGNFTTYSYDGRGRVIQAINPEGHVKGVAYQGSGLSTVTERDGGVWTYSYDANAGVLVRKTDPAGNAFSYTYDVRYNRLSATDPSGETTSYTYDANGNVTSETDAAGSVTAYTYNALDLVTSMSDPLGRVSAFAYDERGNLTSTTDSSGAVTSSEYDARGNLIRRTDALGRVTTYAYDALGNLSSVTDPEGHISSSAYDTAGNVTSRTDAGGATTSYAYDALGRLASVTDPLGHVTSNTYDVNGNRISATDAEGRTTRYEYDARGRLKKTIDPLGNTTTYTYGDTGCSSCGGGGERLVAVTDANGQTTHYEYDLLGRRTREIDPLGNAVTYSYDALGNVLSRTDASGRTTSYSYDALSRRIGASDALGGAVSYAYTAIGQVAQVTDPAGVTTAYAYDNTGRLARTESPDAGATTYAYNPDGTLFSKTDGNGTVVSYSYDAAARLTRISFPDSTRDISFGYDSATSENGAGRLTSMTDPSGTTVYHYDALGRTTREEKTVLGVTYSTSYAYDNVGNLVSLAYPSGRVVSYGYDAVNRPLSVEAYLGTPATLASGMVYDNTGNLLSMALGNGKVTAWSYDGKSRLLTIGVPGLMGLAYSYDNTGNVISIADSVNPDATRSFSYDAMDRLAQAQGPFGALSWTYDGNGNRLTQTGAIATTYSYAGNRLTSANEGGTLFPYTFDGAGNSTSDGRRQYVYDQNQRLIQVLSGGTELGEYAYDGKGRRAIKKTGPGSIGSSTAQNTVYHYDLAGRLIAETAGDGRMLTEYVYLSGKPLAMIRKQSDQEETFFYHDDHLGTPEVMTDKLGRPVWNVEFDPFGNEVAYKGRRGAYVRNVTSNLRFPGQYFDEESGLHQNFHRDYDPRVGRYVEADPIGISEEGTNLYFYSDDSPVNRIDPSGFTSLIFNVRSGWLYVNPERFDRAIYFIEATSGKGSCMNNPDCECNADQGPIPRGGYYADVNQISNPGIIWDILRNILADWGDWRVPLEPNPDTNTFGRTGFKLHGGRNKGSAGCIDVGGGRFGNEATDRLLTDLVYDPDRVVPVFVR